MSFPPFATHVSHPTPHGPPPSNLHRVHPVPSHPMHINPSAIPSSMIVSQTSSSNPLNQMLPSLPCIASSLNPSPLRYRDSYIKKTAESIHSLNTLHSSSSSFSSSSSSSSFSSSTLSKKSKSLDKVEKERIPLNPPTQKKAKSKTPISIQSKRRHSLPITHFILSDQAKQDEMMLLKDLNRSSHSTSDLTSASNSSHVLKELNNLEDPSIKDYSIFEASSVIPNSKVNSAFTSSKNILAHSSATLNYSSRGPLTSVAEESIHDDSSKSSSSPTIALTLSLNTNHSTVTENAAVGTNPFNFQHDLINQKLNMNDTVSKSIHSSLSASNVLPTPSSTQPVQGPSRLSPQSVQDCSAVATSSFSPLRESSMPNSLLSSNSNFNSNSNAAAAAAAVNEKELMLHTSSFADQARNMPSCSPTISASIFSSQSVEMNSQNQSFSNSLKPSSLPMSTAPISVLNSTSILSPSTRMDFNRIQLDSLPPLEVNNDRSFTTSPVAFQTVIPETTTSSSPPTALQLPPTIDSSPPSDPPDLLDTLTYPPTQLQQFMYLTCHPMDDLPLNVTLPPVVVTMYHFPANIDVSIFKALFHRFLLLNPILLTRFSTNPKIVDSDIDAIIDMKVDLNTYLQVIPHVLTKDAEVYVLEQQKQWTPLTFKCFLQSLRLNTYFYVVMSPALGDELSSDLLASILFHIYSFIQKELSSPTLFPSIQTSILNFPVKELASIQVHPLFWQTFFGQPCVDFLDYAEDEASTPNTKRDQSMIFFKSQVLESKQDYVDFVERHRLEQEIQTLEVEVKNKETQIQALVNRIASYEIEWTQTESNRKKMELAKQDTHKLMYHEQGEAIFVSDETYEQIQRHIYEEGCMDLPGFLKKQGIHNLTPYKKMTLPEFADLSESQVTTMSSIEKRKVMNCIEYVRNRVKETLQDLAKLKFHLEKKSLRYKRDIQTLRVQLEGYRSEVDKMKHELLKCNNKLHPPLEFGLYPMAHLEVPSSSSMSYFGFPFQTAILQKLSRYAREFCKSILPKASTSSPTKSSSQSLSLASQTTSSLDTPDTSMKKTSSKDLAEEEEDEEEQVMHIFLALFAILIKHITGLETFVIGLKFNQRRTRLPQGIGVGPLTRLVPFRVDLRDLNQPLSQFIRSISNQARLAKRRAMHLAADVLLYHEIEVEVQHKKESGELDDFSNFFTLPKIVFEWMCFDDYQFLETEYHFSPHFFLEDASSLNSVSKKSLCTTLPFDLQFRCMCLDKMQFQGGFMYASSLPIERWAEKFQFLFENIDIQQRHLSIATVISRFYHSAWSLGSSLNVDGSRSLGSIAELRQSIAALMKEDQDSNDSDEN